MSNRFQPMLPWYHKYVLFTNIDRYSYNRSFSSPESYEKYVRCWIKIKKCGFINKQKRTTNGTPKKIGSSVGFVNKIVSKLQEFSNAVEHVFDLYMTTLQFLFSIQVVSLNTKSLFREHCLHNSNFNFY